MPQPLSLMRMVTCSMSTVASTTLAIYVTFLEGPFPRIAGHVISASILSIPAAAMVSKLILPETDSPVTLGTVPPEDASIRHRSSIAA